MRESLALKSNYLNDWPMLMITSLFTFSARFLQCLFFLLIFSCGALYALEDDPSLERLLREKVSYYLLVGNDTKAVQEADEAMMRFPESLKIRQLYFEALSNVGDEKKLLRSWQQFSRDFPSHHLDSSILEFVAKGVLRGGALSEMCSAKQVRFACADAFTDSSSVQSLREGLQDSNYIVREMALEAALTHGDEVLSDQILKLLEKEQVARVRRKAFEVLIRIQGDQAKPVVEKALNDPNLSYHERITMILGFLEKKETIERADIEEFAKSPHTIERMIACCIFQFFKHQEDTDILKDLVKDPVQDVQKYAIMSIGALKLPELDDAALAALLKPCLEEGTTEVALLASWALMLRKIPTPKHPFRDFLFHSNQKIRLQAASLIAYSQPFCQELAVQFFNTHSDPFVRLNLSVALLKQRICSQEACDEVFAFLESSKSTQYKTSLPFSMETIWPLHLSEASLGFVEQMPASLHKEVVQLSLLNLLAVLGDDRAPLAISKFLDNHHSSVALSFLDQFIRSESPCFIEMVRSFFDHPDLNKRVRAAALVAMMKKDEKALKILYESYPLVDKKLKEMIVVLVGQIASKDSIPFLMEVIYHPSQSLRVIAASSLMQCIRS